MLIPGKAGSTTTTAVSASCTASRSEDRVGVTAGSCRAAFILDGRGARPHTNLAGGGAVCHFSGLRCIGDSDVLEQCWQALGVVQRLPKTCRLVSACESGDLFLQCRFLDGGDEIQRCLRRRLAPTKPRHAVDHSVIPKCGGFARRTLGMSPQPVVTQSSDHTWEIQQREQECRDPEYPAPPSHRKMDHVIV